MTSSDQAGVGSAHVPAELDRRFYAYVIDRAIGWGLGATVGALLWFWLDEHRTVVLAGAVAGTIVLVSLIVAVLQGTSGATPGKSALGIRTFSVDTGQPPGLGRALTRSLILGAAGLPTAGLGVATLAWTAAMDRHNRRQAWHDRVTRSMVVEAGRVEPEQQDVVAGPRAIVNLTAMRLMPAPEAAFPNPQPPQQSARQPARPTGRPPARSDPEPTAPKAEAPRLPAAPAPSVPAASTAGPDQSPEAVAASARWRVEFDSGESFVVEGLALVGRGPQPRPGEAVRHVVPLRSTDMSLSKTHAQFHVARDGVLVVMDRGSTNGSVLIRKGMSRDLPAGKPATLVEGDRVKFGDREMLVAREP